MDEKLFLLHRHPCTQGLSDKALRELAELAKLRSAAAGECVHEASHRLSSMYLVVQGRFRATLHDARGNMITQRVLMPGSQFGALAAAQPEPVPMSLVAEEPSQLLEFEYQQVLRYSGKHPAFQLNMLQLLGTTMRQVLLAKRVQHKPAIVGIVHQSAASRELTGRLIRRLLEIEESPCVLSDHDSWEAVANVPFRSLLANGAVLGPDEVREQLAAWKPRGRIFVDVSAQLEWEALGRLFGFADIVLWCVTSRDCQQAAERIHTLEEKVAGWRDKVHLVWLLRPDERAAPLAPELTDLVSYDFKVSFSDPPANCGRQSSHGLERIVHHLRGVRVGVALGGGAARGMAHLGVLKALEQYGIVVDMLAGTSAGAMVGTVYASGLDADYSAACFAEDLEPGWLFRRLPHGLYWYLMYKYRRSQFDPMLRKYLLDLRLEQLPLPMNTVTVDLVGGAPVVRDSGDAVDAILESINLPGLSAPILRPSGQALVDGGLINNVPANVLVSKGCNFVIAVSVTARLEPQFGRIRAGAQSAVLRAPSTLQTLMRSYLVQNVNMNAVGIQPADETIEPDVTQFDLAEFTRTPELAAVGEQATLQAIPRVTESLTRLDKQLFRSDRSP